MSFLKEHPFVRFLLPFILGISLAYQLPVVLINPRVLFLSTTFLFFVIIPVTFHYRYQFIKGLVLNLWLLTLGILVTWGALSNRGLTSTSTQTLFMGRLLDIPAEKEKVFKAEIRVEAQQIGSEWKKQEAKLIAYFEKDSIIAGARAGQQIVFRTPIAQKETGTNPFGFDYQKYLKLKQVESSVYLKKEDWQFLKEPAKGMVQRALNLRKKIIGIFESAGLTGNELAVVSALTLGYKNKMEASIRDAYTAAGVVHVLAVSGAHVAIIFMALSLFLKLIPGISKVPRLKYTFLIFCLWVYAFITGLSPSVCRATTMFSFVLIGNLLNKRSSIYNSMAASAMLLLLIHPLWLFDIGFQLSYIAVVGIVFFYPKIYGWFYFKYKWADYIWSLTAISLAAQLITTPLTLYYFHVFPTYFWLSNIVVVIGATLLTYSAALLLLVAKIPILFQWLGFVVKYLLIGMNGFVLWITQLPNAQISQIPMNELMLLLFIILIFSFTSWLMIKNYRSLLISLSVVLMLVLVNNYQRIKQRRQAHICVYQIPSQTAIQFIQGEKSWWFSSNTQPDEAFKKLVSEANLYWGTTQNQYYNYDSTELSINEGPLLFHSGLWEFLNYRGIIFNKSNDGATPKRAPLKLDLAIVSGNPSFNGAEVSANFTIEQWVADGSVPAWEITNWKTPGDSLFFMTNIQGAFIKSFSP